MDFLKWIEVDLGAIRSNLAWVRGRLRPGVRLMAVVKADAYGHGAAAVARALGPRVDCLGVLTLEEALELRGSGIKAPIVLLSPILPGQAASAARARLEATVDSLELIRALELRASRLPVHVDVDYGLRRWGVAPESLEGFLGRLGRTRLVLRGLSTHLDYVPGKNAVEAEKKLSHFDRLSRRLLGGRTAVLRHAANTSILLDFPHWQMDMVRIGNLLYGFNPASAPASLRNPWKFCARIIRVARIRKGAAVGYGSEYIAPRAMTVATVPAGYSDGLTMEPVERLISFGRGLQYWGMLKGKQAPFIGRCGISHAMLDVSRVPDAKPGDAVFLPIRKTAASPRLPRVYLNA